MAFVPRDQFRQPRAFSRLGRDPEPAEGVDSGDTRYRAALLQHFLARAVRDAMVERDRVVAQVLEAVGAQRGLSKDRVERKLRGEVGMQFADLAFWAEQFPDVAIAVGEYIKGWAGTAAPDAPQPRADLEADIDDIGRLTLEEKQLIIRWRAHNVAQLRARSTGKPPLRQ